MSRVQMPKVSVIIPCFNQAEFLEECVNSVLQQTMQDFEIIVVDDGSTDKNTLKILNKFKKPKTVIIKQKNMGLVGARNTGIKHAKGKYILPLDCDDKIAPVFLEKCSNYMDANDNCGICGGLTEFFGDKTGVWDLPKYSFPEFLQGNVLVCTHMFRKADWKKIGGYNPNMKYGLEDWNFWLSVIEMGRTVHQFDEVMFYYRKHGETMVANLSKSTEHHAQMLKQIVENHRQTYARYPKYIYQLTGKKTLKIKIKNFLIRFLCLFIPTRNVRHKIKDFFN